MLRRGVPYTSLDVVSIPHHRTREPFVEISQANPGLIRRDLRPDVQHHARAALGRIPSQRLLEIVPKRRHVSSATRCRSVTRSQSPEDYVGQLSATTGMPHVLVRRNMQKIAGVLTQMATVLRGLTRGLDLGLLDAWHGEHGGHALSFYPRTESLGVVLPSNSPGVHSLWVPAIPSEDAARAQARQRRTVDAVSHRAGVHQGRVPAGGVQLLPGRPCRRRRDRPA